MSDSPTDDPRAEVERHAPWLLAPELAVCVVGSSALAEACRRAGVPGPRAVDLDLAWALSPEQGDRLLQQRGVARPTTDASRERGTLAFALGGRRVEITSFRSAPGGTLERRIVRDLRARDMTIGALSMWLAEDRVLDPLGGLDDWRARRIVPCGDPMDRIREHPIRWIRYYRRAHALGFTLDPSIRKLRGDAAVLRAIPGEALAAELRAGLLQCASPGRWLLELHECGVLVAIAPELAPQFDGRPAGPLCHHPEVSQALHLILALEWIAERSATLPPRDRLAVILAVLCHDLGKGTTPAEELPSHPGHEARGAPLLRALLARLPGLADAPARRLADLVCRLHLLIRRFDELRPGTLVRLFDRHFRHRDLRADLFALAVAADGAGRLGHAAEGDAVAQRVQADIEWLRARCASVDAARLRERFGAETAAFRAELHALRCAALRAPR